VNILVLNCGSSSVKFQIISTDAEMMESDSDRRLVRGLVDRIGGAGAMRIEVAGRPAHESAGSFPDPRTAVDRILDWVDEGGAHGGERFRASARIDGQVLAGIEACIDLAPLHNPANLEGIRAVAARFGEAVPQVAVFDTAFHTTMPPAAYLYGLPYEHYQRHRIRRYGFHGTSHRYVFERYCSIRGKDRSQVRLVTLHLGNGCSACAIRDGHSIDTSMGYTPLEGLLMGTRSGDLDPSIVGVLSKREHMEPDAVEKLLNEESGLLGLSGRSRDMRDLLAAEQQGDERARLAIDLFCYRVRKYIGAYHAVLGGAEAVVFTGGIGENAASVRQRVGDGLEALGLCIDPERNARVTDGRVHEISVSGSALAAWVIPTDEELLIARDTFRVVSEEDPDRRDADD